MKPQSATAEYRGRRVAGLRAWLVFGALACLTAAGSRAQQRQHLQVPASAVSPARLTALSAAYRGTPYKLDCLGEARSPDHDPLYTRKYADCQTLVEQVMAEAVAPHVGGLDSATRLIRYRGSEPAIQYRHHYCIPDWLEHPWPVRDVTDEVGGKQVRTVTRRIDLPKLLAGRKAKIPANVLPHTITTPYIPRTQVRTLLPRIPDGSIVVFVLDRPGIVAGHLGFAFRTKTGVVLRHASQRQMQVIDEPLAQYIGTARKSVIGIKVLQPDVQGLRRNSPN